MRINRDWEVYYGKFIRDGITPNNYKAFISKHLGLAIDKKRAKEELINHHSRVKSILDEIDFHIRLASIPSSDIDCSSVYTKAEAIDILKISKCQLRLLLNKGIIKYHKVNERVHRPFQWSVNNYLYNSSENNNEYQSNQF